MRPARLLMLAHEGAWVIVGQLVAASGTFVVTWMLAHRLAPDEFGRFSLGLTATAVAQSVLFGPWAGAALRFDGLAASRARSRAFLVAVLARQWRLTAIASVLGAVAIAICWLRVGGASAVLAGLATLAAIAAAWAFLASNLQTARRQRALVALHQAAMPWLRLGLALATLAAVGASGTAAMLGWALATVAVAASQWRRVPAGALDDGMAIDSARMVAYAAPFALWGAFYCGQAAADRWALGAAVGLDAVGVYSAAFMLGYAPAVLVGSFVEQMVAPVAFAGAGDTVDRERLAIAHRRVRLATALLLAAIALAALVLWSASTLVQRLLPPTYAESARWMVPLFIAGGVNAAAQILTIAPLASLDSRRILIPKIATAVIATTMICFGAWRGGVYGVVVAQIAAATLNLGWMFALTVGDRRRAVT